MKLWENSSYRPLGASYTAQGPQKQSEILISLLFRHYKQTKHRFISLYSPLTTLKVDAHRLTPDATKQTN